MYLKKWLGISFQLILVLSLSLMGFTKAVAAPMAGAIFTTDGSCTGTNLNIFTSKDLVYLDGGPTHPRAAGLPDGYYYVKVTEPDGTVLGTSIGASNEKPVQVSGGEFVQCYQLAEILIKASNPTKGYDSTSNPGGEYKVWASMVSDFPNDGSKTDNFKVKPGVTNPASLSVTKFYDANANGVNDDELLIDGWKIFIEDSIKITRFTPVNIQLDPDAYVVSEDDAGWPWIATTDMSVPVTLAAGEEKSVEFGNLCMGPGGGLTLGFWSNKNGQALIGADDLALLVALHLRGADGSNFDPASIAAFRTWLLGGNAVNMAYMLSVQLAAMELNVFNGKVEADALIYAPGVEGANNLGFATVNDVMDEANTELGLHGLTPPASQYRAYQEGLKIALDKANNNQTFVQPEPCDLPADWIAEAWATQQPGKATLQAMFAPEVWKAFFLPFITH